MNVTGGATSVSTYFKMRLAADGTAATGLTATNFDLTYVRSGAAPAAKVDATAGTAGGAAAWSASTVVEPDATNQPGLYRIDWVDAAFAAGVREVILTAKCATAFTEELRVQIDPEVSVTEWNGVKLATTNPLPNAVADAAGGLATSAGGATGIDDLATPTNITAGTIATVTTLTNLPTIPANWITTAGITDGALTAAKFAASSLNGKGDWNVGKTGYSLTATTGLGNQTANITGTLSGSVGSVTGFTAANIATIMAQTDKFQWTATNQVQADTQYINATAIVGDGAGTPFNV